MYRTLYVLTLLTLQAGLAHSFSWDIVSATSNRLNFYNEGKLTHTVGFKNNDIDWVTYDSFNNRVLFTNRTESVLSFDIATGKTQTLIDFQPTLKLEHFAYDPPTGLLFAICDSYKIYSYHVTPGVNIKSNANLVIDLKENYWIRDPAVDSCGGYIYWNFAGIYIERVRIDGSEKEEIISSKGRMKLDLTIDSQTQMMYWIEHYDTHSFYIHSAELNGVHRKKLIKSDHGLPNLLTVSKDFIYCGKSNGKYIWQIPKNIPIDEEDVKPKIIALNDKSTHSVYRYIAANYAIEEQTQGIPLCERLKRQLSIYDSETNGSDSINVSRVSGDTWNVPVCQYYCLQGHCSVSADGQPKCRCNAGYAGVRCEVNACQTYCLHGGVCSLSEQNNPVCQCTAGYQGERCDVPAFLIKCSQTVSMLKDILNADLTSVTEGKRVNSTCSSTVV